MLRGLCRSGSVACVIVGWVAVLATSAAGEPGDAPSFRERLRRVAEAALERRCLTPAVDGVFRQAIDAGVFQSALGTAFELTGVTARDRRIDLTVAKPASAPHTVTLALEPIVGRTPEGRGGAFVFYLPPGTDAESSRVLLVLAGALAERIPASALAPCRDQKDAVSTREVALLSAALAMLVVVVALLCDFWMLKHAAAARDGR